MKVEDYEFCLLYDLPICETNYGIFIPAEFVEELLKALDKFVPEELNIEMEEREEH